MPLASGGKGLQDRVQAAAVQERSEHCRLLSRNRADAPGTYVFYRFTEHNSFLFAIFFICLSNPPLIFI